MKRIAAIALVVLACGEGGPTCVDQERIQEVIYGLAEDLQRLNLQLMREDGWNCQSDGAIRNAFGGTIGQRYRCTRCD